MERTTLPPRVQGDLGELSAIEWLVSRGASVFIPIGHSPDVDLIASLAGEPLRIEVKTCARADRAGRWKVAIATRGGNRSWSGSVKYFDPARCDLLFVLVGDGRRWLIPTSALECSSGLTLGGPKYSDFEIESGSPLRIGPPLESQLARGSAEVGESGRSVKSVPSAEWVRFPPPPSGGPDGGSRSGARALRHRRTTISTKHQVTIPSTPFEQAGLRAGDRMQAHAVGIGRVVLERVAVAHPAARPRSSTGR